MKYQGKYDTALWDGKDRPHIVSISLVNPLCLNTELESLCHQISSTKQSENTMGTW